jgi:hypothetical protein
MTHKPERYLLTSRNANAKQQGKCLVLPFSLDLKKEFIKEKIS